MTKRLILLGLLVLIFGRIQPIYANAPTTVFLVNSTNDLDDNTCNSSHCSLREAIEAANDSGGLDVIRFDFTTQTTIQPDNPLPEITSPVIIDGITGTGSTCPTSATTPANLKIIIDGINANNEANGFWLGDGSNGSRIEGLNIVRFDGNGILIDGDSFSNTIVCNHIGLPNADIGGYENATHNANYYAINIEYASDIHDGGFANQIGDGDFADRNVIVGRRGVRIAGLLNEVTNNYIGTSRDGSVGLGVANVVSKGILITGSGNNIGDGTTGNVIGGYYKAIQVVELPSNDTSNNSFKNNKIGTDQTGNNPIPNDVGIELEDADMATVGGAGDGNIIAYNEDVGLLFSDSADMTISHNTIRNNGYGIDSGTLVLQPFNDDNLITANTIYDNTEDGIRLASTDRATVTTNSIYDNAGHGLHLDSGDDTTVTSNTIYGNGLDGIRLDRYSTGNTLRQNAIYDNGGLGIDLETTGFVGGISPNDTNDTDNGGNNLQNYPVLVSAEVSGLVTGSFQRDTDNTFGYTVDVYVNDSCDNQTLNGDPYGEGKTWLTSFTLGLGVTLGTFNWSENLGILPPGKFLTMTATDFENNTSEFSNCIPIDTVTLVVNNIGNGADGNAGDGICDTGSAGICTLPAAVDEINALGGGIIHFNITGPANIFLVRALEVTEPVIIDGSTNSGANCSSGNLTVTVIGQAVPLGEDMLTLAAGSGGSTVKGLVLVDAPLDAIHIESDNNLIQCNKIGVQNNGNPLANGEDGVHVEGGSGNVIGGVTSAENNTFASNNRAAVRIDSASKGTSVLGNIINNSGRHAVDVIDSTNTTITSNSILDSGTIANGSGIRIIRGSGIDIGGASEPLGNTIAGYSGSGIYMDSGSLSGGSVSEVLIQWNTIGVSSRQARTANTFDGIHVDDDSSKITIRDNTITQNGRNGIRIDNDSSGVQILSNSITGNQSIGIDLAENNQPNANDIGQGDSDTGANGLQNYPNILSTKVGDGIIEFELDSKPGVDHIIQLFSNSVCDGTHGEGATFIGEMTVTTNGFGYVKTNWTGGGFVGGDVLTATATDANLDGTSEFSTCFSVGLPTAVQLQGESAETATTTDFIVIFGFILLAASGFIWWRTRCPSCNKPFGKQQVNESRSVGQFLTGKADQQYQCRHCAHAWRKVVYVDR